MNAKGRILHTYIKRSSPDSPRNDTANILELDDGTLLAVWHSYRRNDNGASDFGTAAIAAAESTDGGRTWRNERIVVDVLEGDLNVQAPALCRLSDGRILLMCNRAHARNSTSMVLYTSTDRGLTFEEYGSIWEHHEGQLLQGGTSSLLKLSSGRLLVPVHGGTGDQWSQHNTIACFISEDEGSSWRMCAGSIDLPMRGAMEPSVAELASGKLVMSIRTQLGAVFLSTSEDGGETWSLAQASNLKSPESCTCLRRIPGSDRIILFWNDNLYDPGHHHYGIRTPLSAAYSDDDGTSFHKIGDIDTGDAMFTNLNCTFTDAAALVTYLHVDDGEVVDGVFHPQPKSLWHNGHIGLKCAIIDREWFTGSSKNSRGRRNSYK